MPQNNYNINYEYIDAEKPMFVFVNHKLALLCWAKIKNENGLCDVLTFDSHGDFGGGMIFIEDLTKTKLRLDKNWLGSKYTRTDLPPFSSCKEFVEWDLLDQNQNKELIQEKHRFLKCYNDNFIDVAFMKNVINDVHQYYLNLDSSLNVGRCDDLFGNDHNMFVEKFTDSIKHDQQFILDIDLDFFVDNNGEKVEIVNNLDKYMKFLHDLFLDTNCVAITLALEPNFCGGKENCLILVKKLSEFFGNEVYNIAKKLLISFD